MNVLIISGNSHTSIGGAEKYIREVISIGLKHKINFYEISILPNYQDTCKNMCDSTMLSTIFSKKSGDNKIINLLDFVLKMKMISKYLKYNKTDLIIINGANVTLSKKYLYKSVFIQHSDNSYYENLSKKFYFKFFNVHTIFKKAKHLICFSDNCISRFKQTDPDNKRLYFKIPLFMSTLDDLDTSPQDIIYVGRFSKEKGVEKLIELAKALNEPIHVYGAGPVSMCNRTNIISHGYIDPKKISSVFQNAKLNILLSNSEGLPFSIIEGFSYGIPCLILDSFVNARFIWNEGTNGFLCEKDVTINDLSKFVKLFKSSDFHKHEIKRFCRENFAYSSFVSNWETIFSNFKS